MNIHNILTMEKSSQCISHYKYDATTLHMFRTDSLSCGLPRLYRQSDLRPYFPEHYLWQEHNIEESTHIAFLGTASCNMRRVNAEFRRRNCDPIDLLTRM